MPKNLFVKPNKDLQVRDPLTGLHLPSYGKGVVRSSFWIRRLGDGDVVKTTEAEIAKGKAAEAKVAKATEAAVKEKE